MTYDNNITLYIDIVGHLPLASRLYWTQGHDSHKSGLRHQSAWHTKPDAQNPGTHSQTRKYTWHIKPDAHNPGKHSRRANPTVILTTTSTGRMTGIGYVRYTVFIIVNVNVRHTYKAPLNHMSQKRCIIIPISIYGNLCIGTIYSCPPWGQWTRPSERFPGWKTCESLENFAALRS